MNQHIQKLIDFITKAENLSAQEKAALIKAAKDADSELSIAEFKLERAEKVKSTSEILVEALAREAQIELSLERVRARTMAMQKSDELAETAYVLFQQFEQLGEDPEQLGIGIFNEKEAVLELWTTINGKIRENPVIVSLAEPIVMRQFYAAWKEEKKTFIIDISGKELERYNDYRNSLSEVQMDPGRMKDRRVISIAYFSKGAVSLATSEPRPPETLQLLERFANVFDLTYTRFLDLKKAEAQSREAQIELALERVRARTMAMQKSEELPDTSLVLFQQLKELGEPAEQLSIGIINEAENIVEVTVTLHGKPLTNVFRHSIDEPRLMNKIYTSWKAQQKILVVDMQGEELQAYNKYRNELIGTETFTPKQHPGDRRVVHSAFFSKGMLALATNEPRPQESLQLLQRFAKVFDGTYTRFLDLQKAEAQVREAQIEASLERVRARTMAMHSSDDVSSAIATLFTELDRLDIENVRCGIATINNNKTMEVWSVTNVDDGKTVKAVGKFDMNAHKLWQLFYGAWINKSGFLHYYLSGKEKQDYIDILNNAPHYLSQPILEMPDMDFQSYHFNEGAIWTFSMQPHTEERQQVMKRFTAVFSQTFRRYQDLQKAEAQVREAQIEAALERTRTQSMMMQHSKELDDTLRVFHEQVQLLGINSAFSFLWLPDEEKEKHLFWAIWEEIKNGAVDFKNKSINYPLNRNEPATAQCLLDWKGDEPVVSYAVPPEGVENYFAAWQELIDGVESLKPAHFRGGLYYIEAFMKYGCFGVIAQKDLTGDEKKILGRFAIEFERTYTRFLDLQKAETQAREAQIEAALERVRSRAMAMQKSGDLSHAVAIVFEELDRLNLGMLRCGIGILNREKRTADVFTTAKSDKDTVVQVSGDESMDAHPLLTGAFEAWLKQVDHSYILKGEDLNNYYKALTGENFHLPEFQSKIVTPGTLEHHYYVATFSAGGLFAFRESAFSEEAINILRRFADVFDFTYTRFNDIKKAEAQTLEANIEVALERVRSRTLAMQKSDELAETAAVLFRQLINLGIAPNRLYIAIVKDDNGEAEFWITDEDGSKVSSAFETNLNDNTTFKRMFTGWKAEKKSLVIDMQGNELQEYFKYLTSINVPFKGGLDQKRRVQDIAYFGKGFIGIASPDEQPGETISLLERFAAVFNLTYTRFNDLKIAEAHARQAEEDLQKLHAEKKRTEEALSELQATQKQLIQSEKMASLGELTAGIAHEIQNPLNFVNNFSEVSNELIAEMVDEVDKGNMDEVKVLANDIKQNLEKINHHGKRADAIVKGMLQHSRSSSGQKEPTDINALCDEYLRLSYHGLRAKDKSFNAVFKTDFDNTLEKINVLPQDIGRVILNLLTNAFYAVNEKALSAVATPTAAKYEPTVSVSTKKLNGKIEIRVTDNGNGIPQKVLDKIFQPFFTTKPTGQGTGLGLSLSYDIVKAHGGELRVETTEGICSIFIIQLPIN